MNLSRRTILTGLLAAPIVVRAGLIMPVKRFMIAEYHYRVVALATAWQGNEWVVFEDSPQTLNCFTGNHGFQVGDCVLFSSA